VLEKLKQRWHEFEEDTPGQRFQQRYRRRQQARRSVWRRALFISGGMLIMAVGLFMFVAPGPGIVTVFIGAGLVAQESLLAARALDWTEVKARKLTAWSFRTWRRAPLAAKILLVLCALAAAAASAYVAYLLLFAR
jgi:uncharacterized protein (TIGR02611 family)